MLAANQKRWILHTNDFSLATLYDFISRAEIYCAPFKVLSGGCMFASPRFTLFCIQQLRCSASRCSPHRNLKTEFIKIPRETSELCRRMSGFMRLKWTFGRSCDFIVWSINRFLMKWRALSHFCIKVFPLPSNKIIIIKLKSNELLIGVSRLLICITSHCVRRFSSCLTAIHHRERNWTQLPALERSFLLQLPSQCYGDEACREWWWCSRVQPPVACSLKHRIFRGWCRRQSYWRRKKGRQLMKVAWQYMHVSRHTLTALNLENIAAGGRTILSII